MTKLRRVITALLAALIVGHPVYAAPATPAPTPPFDPYYNTSNNIIYYDDPSQSTGCGGGISGFPPTSAKLDSAALGRIAAEKPVYQQASAQTKVPWQIYAGLDYREDNNRPDASMLGGEPLGTTAPDSGKTPHTKLESVLLGSQILQGLAKEVYGVDVTQQLDFTKLQQALIVYNRGHAYKNANQSPDTSPYVMDQYDSQHQNMKFPSIPGETLGGGGDAGRLGAMTVIALINDGNNTLGASGSGSCFGAGVGAKVDYSSIYPVLDAGTLPDSMLCSPRPSQPGFRLLKGPACDSFLALDAAYKADFGVQIPVGGGYRTAAEQIACGGTKAHPGGNNPACIYYDPKNDPPEHLWGTAIDFSGPLTDANSSAHKWLEQNGPNFGWFWPNWAKAGHGGNAGVREAWHFAYYFKGHNPSTDKLESFK